MVLLKKVKSKYERASNRYHLPLLVCFVLSCRKQLLANGTAHSTFIGLDKKNEKKRRKVRKKIWGKLKKSERCNEPILKMSCYRGMEG